MITYQSFLLPKKMRSLRFKDLFNLVPRPQSLRKCRNVIVGDLGTRLRLVFSTAPFSQKLCSKMTTASSFSRQNDTGSLACAVCLLKKPAALLVPVLIYKVNPKSPISTYILSKLLSCVSYCGSWENLIKHQDIQFYLISTT